MIWVSWRQQRAETLLAAGLLLLVAALFVPVGIHLAAMYDQQGIAACVGKRTEACQQALSNFGASAGILRSALGWFTLLPGLLGVALAAPLVLELENGTVFFGWTQGVTRARWLAAKLGVAVVSALVASGALTLILMWYRRPLDAAYGRLDNAVYDVEGIVPLSYVLFALGLGLAVGVVWRRTAPSVVLAFLSYVGGRVFVDSWLRQRLTTLHSATWGFRSPGPILDRAWIVFQGPSDRAGRPFHGGFGVLQACAHTTGGRGFKGVDPACLARHGAGFNHAVYVPASSFWPLQAVEFALFGGVGIALLGFAAWWILRRAE